jgi:hypothetical protein
VVVLYKERSEVSGREVRRREMRGMNLSAVFLGPLVIDSRYVLLEEMIGKGPKGNEGF